MKKNITSIIAFCALSTLLPNTAANSQQSENQMEASQPSSSPFLTKLFYYPKKGQSIQQQNRDRYECYLWAYKKTGFEPSRPNLAPHQKLQLIAEGTARHENLNATTTTTSGTKNNQVLGYSISGNVTAASSASTNFEDSKNQKPQYDQNTNTQHIESERKSSDYRRALTACLEGRGYTVR